MAGAVELSVDGASASPEDLVSVALVNYGAYTSFRVEEGGVRGLDLHLVRLEAEAETARLASEIERQEQAARDAEAARQQAQVVDGGRFDEVCEVWDASDRLVAQATQLAAIRIPEGLQPPS